MSGAVVMLQLALAAVYAGSAAATLGTNTTCHLRPGAPASYSPFCNDTKTEPACVALNKTCVWGGATPASICSLKPGAPSAYKAACDAAKTAASCAALARTCTWGPPTPPPSPPGPPAPPPVDPTCSCKPACQGGGGGANTCSEDDCICSQCYGLLKKFTACDYARGGTTVEACQACFIHNVKVISPQSPSFISKRDENVESAPISSVFC